jgi:DNA-binding beta-propeller fold protein YncE
MAAVSSRQAISVVALMTTSSIQNTVVARIPIQEGIAMSRNSAIQTSAHPDRDPGSWSGRRNAALAAAAALVMAGTMAWTSAASASAGQVSGSAHARRVAGPARSLLSPVRQRAVRLPPTAPTGNGPDGLALDSATHTLYSSNQNASSVTVINTAACNAADTRGCRQRVRSVSLPASASPQGIALNRATGTIYVANIGDNTISVINARTCNAVQRSGCGQVPASIRDPGGPIALAVDQATDTVYVANTGDNFSGKGRTVAVINGAICNGHQHSGCGQRSRKVRVGGGPDGVAVDQATDTVYTVNDGANNNNGDTVSVINGATCNARQHSGCGQTPPAVRVGHGPFWIAVDQATRTAYTANNTDSTVSVINTAICNARRHSGCGQRTATVPVGNRPWAATIDGALHTVFVVNNQDDTMSALNSATCNASNGPGCARRPPASQVGKGPQAVLTDPATGTIYAANFTDNTVSVIRAAGCSAVSRRGCRHEAPTAAVGAGPDAIAVNRATGTVYVANGGGTLFSGSGHTVSVLNAATCNARRRSGCARPAATIGVGTGPAGIAVDRATDTVYVTNHGAGTVSVINGATCNAHRRSGCGRNAPTVAVGSGPAGIAVDQATSTVYVTNEGGQTVSVINAATCNARRHSGCGQRPPKVTVGKNPVGVAVDRATDTIYVTNFGNFTGNTVSVINGATCNGARRSGCGQKPATITVGPVPWGITINQAANIIYVANNNGGDGPASLSVINGAACDATSHSGCGQIPPALPGVGRAPNGIALDQSTRTVYTANAQDATVSVINVARPVPELNPPRVAVGSLPEAIAIDPANRTIYITSAFGAAISILPERPVHTAGTTRTAIRAPGTAPSQRGEPGRSHRRRGRFL